MRENLSEREKESEHGRGSGEATAGERENGPLGRSPTERGGSSWKGCEPQQLKNKRKGHTMPPSNSLKSKRDKKVSVDRSAVLLPGDDVEPSNQIFEKPPSKRGSEPQELKNKRKGHTMPPLNNLKSTSDKKFSVDRSEVLLPGDDVEPSNQNFEKPPSKRGSEPQQLKNKRKKHTMPPSNSLKSVDRSVVLLPGDDLEPSNQIFEKPPSKRVSEPQQLKNKRKGHTMPTLNSLKSTRDKKFSVDSSAVLLPGNDVEPSNQFFEKPPSKRGSEPQQLKNKRKKHTMPPSNILNSVDRPAVLLPGDDLEPSNQNFEKPPSKRGSEPQQLKNKRKKHTMPPSNSLNSVDRSAVLLPGDDLEPSNQIFEKPPSKRASEPQQLKNKRKGHPMPTSNILKSTRDKKFSVDRSAVLLPGDDVEPSNQIFEKPLSKRGAEPRQLEKERKIKKPKFPPAMCLKHKDNSFANFDSSVVPFPGDSTETSLQASKTVQIKREMVHSKPKQSGRTRRRRETKSSIREDDHDAPVQVDQHQLTSLDWNAKSSCLSTSRLNEEVFSASLKPAESCEALLPKNVDSVLDNKKISRSRKRGKNSSSGIQYMEYLSLQLQEDIDSSHSSVIQTRKRRKNSDNVDDISLSVSKSLMPLAENGFNSLTKTVFSDSNNSYIPSDANLDTPDCFNIKIGKESSMASKQNKEVLNTKVHENHNAKISDLPGSISNEDKDATGDLTLKNVASLDMALAGMDCFPISPERALRSTFKKKLLVLDLNGILCDVVFGSHASCMPYKMVGRKAVFRRPFLDDFLTFCFEKFAVGVWSSRNKWNVAGVVDYIMRSSKDKLLFCWDQSKCTVTGFNTIEDRHKPLVLKKLIKLWNKEEASLPWEKGMYSPSNTLLVDDSPYKSLCNPPNTAIFPFPFDYRDKEDNSLGPGGDLRVYLERVAAADDVQEYVKQHSFGQHAITSQDKMWSFYERIIHNNSMALTG